MNPRKYKCPFCNDDHDLFEEIDDQVKELEMIPYERITINKDRLVWYLKTLREFAEKLEGVTQ